MAPLSKLTLTSYRRKQPHRDPVEERRSKTLIAGARKYMSLRGLDRIAFMRHHAYCTLGSL